MDTVRTVKYNATHVSKVVGRASNIFYPRVYFLQFSNQEPHAPGWVGIAKFLL